MSNTRPFNIRIFVVEGVPDGLRHVEKSNWIGLAIVCPRGRYSHVRNRAEFEKSGVYLLIGEDSASGGPMIYVGEADCVRPRLDSHQAEKEFWQQAVVFTTKGDPLNKAEVQYLEHRLVSIARSTRRSKLANANSPTAPSLSEADRATVDGYLDEMLELMPVLGIFAFEQTAASNEAATIFYFSGAGWSASGYETSNGFAVRAGSLARLTEVPSMERHVPSDYRARASLIASDVVEKAADGYRFLVDYEFSSPSQAASVCAGRSSNGRTDWKDAAGDTLKQHQERESRGQSPPQTTQQLVS